MKLFLIAAVSLLFGGLRFAVPGHDATLHGSYEAFAHIWVGVLLAIGCSRKTETGDRVAAWAWLTLISVLELTMFLLR